MPALSWLLWLAPVSAAPCSTPREASAALSSGEPCLDLPADMVGTRAELSEQLYQVLDARGLTLDPDALPAEPEFRDEAGRHRVVPLPELPELVLERTGQRWLWTRSSIRAIPRLHRETFSPVVSGLVEALPPVFQAAVLGVRLWQVAYLALLVVCGLLAGRLLPWLVEAWGPRAARRVGIQLDHDTLRSLQRPLTWFVAAAVVAAGLADLHLSAGASRALRVGAGLLLSVSGVLVAARLVDVISAPLLRRARQTTTVLDDQFVPLATRAARLGVVVLGLLFVLQNWGIDVGSLLAGLGLGGLAVALAAKDTLSNLFGSVTLFTDRPFQVGDWIVLDGQVEGVVEDVGFRSTRIRTFPDSVVSLPNGRVADARIENMGQRRRRRVRTVLALTYGTAPERLQAYVEAIRAYLRSRPDVFPEQIEVHLHELGAHSLDVLVYFFLEVPDWRGELQGRSECLATFLRLASEHQVHFAFPSTSVYIEQLPPSCLDLSRTDTP
jgi:MscS family membrane protein